MKMKDFDLVNQLGKDLQLVEVTPKIKYELNEKREEMNALAR